MLVLGNMYPPHALGGYEMSCRDVVDRLRLRGHSIAVLTTTLRLPDVPDQPGEDQAGIWRQLQFYWSDHRLTSPTPLGRWRQERHNQRVLRRALARHQPDVVWLWNMGAMSLGLVTALTRTGIPLVYAVCDDWLDYGPNLDAWLRGWRARPRLARLAAVVGRVPTTLPADLGHSGAFCFVSDYVRRHAEESTQWTFPCSSVVYSGIDAADFPGEAIARPEWAWRLLFVGRGERRKGLDDAIRALAQLPETATLDVVGRADPEHRRLLDELVMELDLQQRVRFYVAPRSQLAEWYARADAVLFTPIWEEPFGLVPLEAMACGTPVVATATGGSAEFLRDEANCLVVARRDPTGVAEAVRRLATDGQLRDRLVANGRRTAAQFSVDRLADTFEAWLLAAAAGFPERPPDRPRPL